MASSRRGELSIIMGPMYSGKSTLLIQRGDRLQRGQRPVLFLKPTLDQRYTAAAEIRSHQQLAADCVLVAPDTGLWETLLVDTGHKVPSCRYQLRQQYREVHTFLVDEVQFIPDAPRTLDHLLGLGRHVVVAGLSSDMYQRQWPVLAELLPRASHVKMLRACCSRCSSMSAAFTSCVLRLDHDYAPNEALVGSSQTYEARCGACYTRPQTQDDDDNDKNQQG